MLADDNEGHDGPEHRPPVNKELRSIGLLLCVKEAPAHDWWEWRYLQSVQHILTRKWWRIQGGADVEALIEWIKVCRFLEFDQKATKDLFLLLQHGHVGRTSANKIMWECLTGPAIQRPYEDLSNWMTSKVTTYRQKMDRPPRGHDDNWPCGNFPRGWWWDYYATLRVEDVPFSPCACPQLGTKWVVTLGEGGRALAPPACWAQYVKLEGPAFQAIKGVKGDKGKGKGDKGKGKGKGESGKGGKGDYHSSWKGKGGKY